MPRWARRIKTEDDRFGFEPEITAKAARRRAPIYAVGIRCHGRISETGRKGGGRDDFCAIVKYNVLR